MFAASGAGPPALRPLGDQSADQQVQRGIGSASNQAGAILNATVPRRVADAARSPHITLRKRRMRSTRE